MKRLATFKHISSKNANYGDAEKYLTVEHDEFTMKPTLDEQGRLVPREDYRISTLNCGEEDFAVACMRSNLRYGKNQKKEDVKSHHYIISFDPRDGPDNGLTVDRAQEQGERFCKEQFPGHQALVCTHPDGHNHSGNIHVHIVINSLRIEDVPLLPYMLDNGKVLLFIRGELPVCDDKFDIMTHPLVAHTPDGGAPPYLHGSAEHAVAAITIHDRLPPPDAPAEPMENESQYELLSNEELEAIYKQEESHNEAFEQHQEYKPAAAGQKGQNFSGGV